MWKFVVFLGKVFLLGIVLDIGENRLNNTKTGRLLTVWRRAKTTRARHRFEPRRFKGGQSIGD